MRIKNCILIISIILLCLTSCSEKNVQRLTQNQISQLREQYPICEFSPDHIVVRKMTINEVKSIADAFIYCEVIGEGDTYQRKGFEFYEHPVSVIDDSKGKYQKGDIVTIAISAEFKETNPRLKKGMRFVVPVAKDPEKEGRNQYITQGMYYVTEDDYVLSVVDETILYSDEPMTGVKVNELLESLK